MGDDVLACSFVPGEQMAKALSEKRELEKQLEQTKQQLAEVMAALEADDGDSMSDAHGRNVGRRYWTPEEHKRFLTGVRKYGPKHVKAIAALVGTRSVTQVRTHAQKYFMKLERHGKSLEGFGIEHEASEPVGGERGRAGGAERAERKTPYSFWNAAEHNAFLEGLKKFGRKDVKSIAALVGTRTVTQVRTHAQKYFLKLEKEREGKEDEGEDEEEGDEDEVEEEDDSREASAGNVALHAREQYQQQQQLAEQQQRRQDREQQPLLQEPHLYHPPPHQHHLHPRHRDSRPDMALSHLLPMSHMPPLGSLAPLHLPPPSPLGRSALCPDLPMLFRLAAPCPARP